MRTTSRKERRYAVAVIEWTTGKQRVATGTLATIVPIVKNENISNPSMTIVGDVVSLRNQIAWKERKPLHGKSFICIRNK